MKHLEQGDVKSFRLMLPEFLLTGWLGVPLVLFVVFNHLFYELSLECLVLIVLLGLVVVHRMIQPELSQNSASMIWCSSVQAYCFSSSFLFLCSVVADDSESRESTGGEVSCRTGEADGYPFAFRFTFPLPFGGMSTA